MGQRRLLLLFPALLATAGWSSREAAPASQPDCGCAEDQTEVKPAATEPLGKALIHDPVMAKENGRYVVFATGPGIAVRTSTDGRNWGPPGRVFETPPAWTTEAVPGFRGHFWAPDISHFDGRWYLYYSVSTFGKNRSAIGLATNETLNPQSPNYQWVDQGMVVQSGPEDDYNAIDPNLVLDDKGRPWLSFGSFWSGIKLVELDRRTGKPLHPGAKPRAIAARSHANGQPGAIEAPFIFRHGRFYYLFVSFDLCCRGVNSTYNIRVGRAPSVTGPYVDRDGKPMTEDGGTLVLAGSERWKGPGHNAVMRDGKRDLLVYHAYDAEDKGAPKLRIEPLIWDREGWPHVAKIQ